MLNRKLLLLLTVALCCTALIAGYNRPYAWWPWIDMSEQHIIKPFEDDGLRDPAEGSVSVGQWEPTPTKIELMTAPDKYTDFKNPVAATEASIATGKELYETYCWTCHGTEMSPDPAAKSPVQRGGKSFYREGAEFTGMPGADINLIKLRSDEENFATMTHGSAIMKRVSYHLSPEERWHVVNYIRSIANKVDQQ
ncbi:Cytochrome c [Sulfidibacter corallicola]|uniref:Cytochrome c n=1 Tax=Sulfidibacter corallicola TaxID=2818388 RepID=A0A8A4TWX7_SULCO|nr:cytochrome c [Sulfidibacter corallicola]QTD53980.1 cytochrome c [Sulfidibacter corallicola]